MRKLSVIAAVLVLLTIVAAVVEVKFILPQSRYEEGVALIAVGKYREAEPLFRKLKGYRDADVYIHYLDSMNGEPIDCIESLESVPSDFLDAKERLAFLYALEDLQGDYTCEKRNQIIRKGVYTVEYSVINARSTVNMVNGTAKIEFFYIFNREERIGGSADGGTSVCNFAAAVDCNPDDPALILFSAKEHHFNVSLSRNADGTVQVTHIDDAVCFTLEKSAAQ